jgi:hypothetical protein
MLLVRNRRLARSSGPRKNHLIQSILSARWIDSVRPALLSGSGVLLLHGFCHCPPLTGFPVLKKKLDSELWLSMLNNIMRERYHAFCDHCPGCRPALIDTVTGQPMADDSPVMLTVNRVWDKDTSYAEREAFINVTLHNSRVPQVIELAAGVARKFSDAFR